MGELTESITAPDGVLASTARQLLGKLGLHEPSSEQTEDVDVDLFRLVRRQVGQPHRLASDTYPTRQSNGKDL